MVALKRGELTLVCDVGTHPFVATWKPHALRHCFPKANPCEPWRPHLHNLKVSITNYQQILWGICTRPDPVSAWHIEEAQPQESRLMQGRASAYMFTPITISN